jgi:hypothetical protein
MKEDRYERSPRMGTLKGIQTIAKVSGAKPVLDKGVEIDESQLDPRADGLTFPNFVP